VFALAAMRAVIVGIVDVGEGGGLEFGVLHGTTVTRITCGLPRDNSYSGFELRVLDEDRGLSYKADAAEPFDGIAAKMVGRWM
jgi:hypothetical protein